MTVMGIRFMKQLDWSPSRMLLKNLFKLKLWTRLIESQIIVRRTVDYVHKSKEVRRKILKIDKVFFLFNLILLTDFDFSTFVERRPDAQKVRVSPQLTLAAFQFMSTSNLTFIAIKIRFA